MSRITAREIIQLCAAAFNVSTRDIQGMRPPGWRDKYPTLRPSRSEKAQFAAIHLIDKHTMTHSKLFLDAIGLSPNYNIKAIVDRVNKDLGEIAFEIMRIEQSIDRIHELRMSLGDAEDGSTQVSGLRGKVYC